jgi:hypothetical protein
MIGRRGWLALGLVLVVGVLVVRNAQATAIVSVPTTEIAR